MSPTISYMDPRGVMRQVQTDPGGREAMQRGFAQLQQAGQFQKKLKEEQRQFDEQIAAADLKARAKALEEAEAAMNNRALRQAYLERSQRMQQDPEFAKQEHRNRLREHMTDAGTLKKAEDFWMKQDEQEAYQGAATSAVRDLESLAGEGAIPEDEVPALMQELQGRVAKGDSLAPVLQRIEGARKEHALQLQNEQDWQEVFQYADAAMESIPRETTIPGPGGQPIPVGRELRAMLTDLKSHQSARAQVDDDPWKFKQEIDRLLAGQQTSANQIIDPLQVTQGITEGWIRPAGEPRGESSSVGAAQEGEQFPGAQPGAERPVSKAALSFALGVEPPQIDKTKAKRPKGKGTGRKGKTKDLGHPDFPMGVR